MLTLANAVDDLYQELVRTARRVSRMPDEARDLVQEALAEALDRGFADWENPERWAWLRGVVRRRAALVARTAARRRRRESHWSAANGDPEPPRSFRWSDEFLATLPQSVRALAGLATADLSGEEIQYALRLSGTAYRQRLWALRGALRQTGDVDAQVIPRAAAGLALGGRRAELVATLQRRPGWVLSIHDPDGHPIVLCSRS